MNLQSAGQPNPRKYFRVLRFTGEVLHNSTVAESALWICGTSIAFEEYIRPASRMRL
jgi:hypothetical protein